MASVPVEKISLGNLNGLIASEYSTPEWRKLLTEPDSLMNLPGARVLKDSPTTRAVVVDIEVAGEKHILHIKRLNRRGVEFTVKYLFQRSRARRLFRNLIALIERDVPTLKPVAALSQRTGPLLHHSFLITEYMDTWSLFEFWEKQIYPAGNLPAARREIMAKVARLVAHMHASGVYHRDLKSSNILVKKNGEPIVADLDGARTGAPVSYTQRVRDLARLSTSLVPLANLADRHVFLRHYIAALGSGDDLKKMGRDIARKGLAILRSKRAKKKYDEHDYRYLDAFAKRQRKWLRR